MYVFNFLAIHDVMSMYILVHVFEPHTVMEALQQRYDDLIKRHQEAISKGESFKARRLDRLSKVIMILLEKKCSYCWFPLTAI